MTRTEEIWFHAMEDVIFCIPVEARMEVLSKLLSSEKSRQETPVSFMKFDADADGIKYWNATNEALSLIIQILVRHITNNHSPEDAAKILYREHRMGAGGRWLPEYLDGLPGLKVDLDKCAKLADSNGPSKLD